MDTARPTSGQTPDQLITALAQTRAALRALIEHLPPDGWLGPQATHLNPPLWEYGHIIWFQERWCLRQRPEGSCSASLLDGADALYDSSAVPHATRWSLPLLEPAAVDAYAQSVSRAVTDRLRGESSGDLAYFAELCLAHERMHIEAWWMAFQSLAYTPPPHRPPPAGLPDAPQRLPFAAGLVTLGSGADEGFIFDNEKWRHSYLLTPYDIDASPVTERAFAAFVDAGGYQREAAWSAAGQAWRAAQGAEHPLYWRRMDGGWQTRRFDRWTPLIADAPMLHVNLYEAEAYAAWAGRRLPTAAQWQRATQAPAFRWGLGWEWTADIFAPYPGFEADPYRDYSEPWFHTHQELRGGGPYTDPSLRRPGFRNFYLPERRDVFAGFRTASRD